MPRNSYSIEVLGGKQELPKLPLSLVMLNFSFQDKTRIGCEEHINWRQLHRHTSVYQSLVVAQLVRDIA